MQKTFLIAFIFVVGVFLVGVRAFAEVRVTEIAWMGTTDHHTNEWIELVNTGTTPVDVTGWILEAEDKSPRIELTGVIGAKEAYILERTSDEVLPDFTASLIYTGALSNSGELLILRSTSTEVVRVDASGGWPAGDNSTKETMQWSGTEWITATATPAGVLFDFDSATGTALSDSDQATSTESVKEVKERDVTESATTSVEVIETFQDEAQVVATSTPHIVEEARSVPLAESYVYEKNTVAVSNKTEEKTSVPTSLPTSVEVRVDTVEDVLVSPPRLPAVSLEVKEVDMSNPLLAPERKATSLSSQSAFIGATIEVEKPETIWSWIVSLPSRALDWLLDMLF